MLNRLREILILGCNALQISRLEIHIQSFLFYAYKQKKKHSPKFPLEQELSQLQFSALCFHLTCLVAHPGPETTMVIRSDFMEEYFMFLYGKRAFGYAETSTPDQQFSDFLM